MTRIRRGAKPKPLTQRGASTRARIINAAADLVAAHGATATSLDQIMAASATSKSQLYHYFADKDALICAVAQAQADRVIGFQESCLKGVTSLAELRKWRDTIVKLNRANGGVGGCPLGSLASELADRSENARELLAASFKLWESHLIAGLTTMIDRGEVSSSADPHDLATAIMTALQGGLLLAQTTKTTRPLELALDMALEHIPRRSTRGAATAGQSRRRAQERSATTRS
jgi:TetR/AcrR family transcriptional repressor of nem operon